MSNVDTEGRVAMIKAMAEALESYVERGLPGYYEHMDALLEAAAPYFATKLELHGYEDAARAIRNRNLG